MLPLYALSSTTTVVRSGDDQEEDVAHKVKSLQKPASIFPDKMG